MKAIHSVITRLRVITYIRSSNNNKIYSYRTGAMGPPKALAPPLANESNDPMDVRPLSPE